LKLSNVNAIGIVWMAFISCLDF